MQGREQRARAVVLGYGVAVLVVAADQATKALVTALLGDGQPPLVIIPGVLEIIYRRNTGMAFSLLLDASLLLAGVALAASVALAVVNVRLRGAALLPRLTVGLLLGGAIGNLIDRLRFGAVIDFVYVSLINFPAFNVADSSLTIGVLLAAWLMSRPGREPEAEAPSEQQR